MRNYITKEEDVAKISTSIFVTNFPESFSAKDLFQSCKQYGHVVDTFIPNKRSKADKRFGFVRFINVFNDERGKHKTYINAPSKYKGFMAKSNSFAQAVKGGGDTVVHEVGNHGEDSDVDEVPETMFDKSSGQKKKQSKDPFGIYPLLDKQRKVNSHGDTVNGESLKYPPGFTPIDATEMMEQSTENVEKQNGDKNRNNNVEESLNGRNDCSDNMALNLMIWIRNVQGDLKSN
nr:nucleotide-binding alpha-beta plait domain-containing protein [Tanacetum cinerariifolium]